MKAMGNMGRGWLGVVLCGLVSLGTYAAPWVLASLTGWIDELPALETDVQGPREAVYWEAAEPEPEVIVELEPEPSVAAEPEPEPAVDALAVPVGSPEVVTEAEPEPTLVAAVRTRRRTLTDAQRAQRRQRARQRRARARRRAKCEAAHPAVREGSDGVVEIDRAYVDEVTKNLQSFMKLGYSRPYNEEGVKGWYISGFGCTSPVHKAGFRRRDILLRINGKKTRSWAGVYLVYQKLKRKTEFEVDLLRKGEPQTFQFRIVEDWSPEG